MLPDCENALRAFRLVSYRSSMETSATEAGDYLVLNDIHSMICCDMILFYMI